MTLSKIYGNIILPFIDQYKDAKNDKARNVVIGNVADAVKKSRETLEDKGMDLPKNLKHAITQYIKGCIKKGATAPDDITKPKKIKQVYSLRDVVKKIYVARVEAEIPYQHGDKEYIGSYQRAITKVQENLSRDELQEAQEVVKVWNKQGAPVEVQLKRAKTRLPKDIAKKVEEWKFESGAVMMCMVAYSDGQDVQAFQVESLPITGHSFTNSYPDWREGTFEKFKAWSLDQFGLTAKDSDDEADVVRMVKAKEITFEKKRDGAFVLPPKANYRTVKQRQRVIRGYIGATYREFTGSKNSPFPYLLAAEEGQTIYSPDSVPKGFVLSDPDHLKSDSINALYSHLLRRQNKGLDPFVVLNPGPHHERAAKKSDKAKGKAKAEYVDISDEEEGEEESEQDEGDDLDSDEGEEKSQDDEGDDLDSDSRSKSSESEEPPKPEARRVRIGPPIKKKKQPAQVQSSDDNPGPQTSLLPQSSKVAGPSTLPPPKNSAKMSTPATRTLRSKSSLSKRRTDPKEQQVDKDKKAEAPALNEGKLKQADSKKRKREKDTEDVPPKLARTRKSGRKVGQEMVEELVGVKPSRWTRSSNSDSLKANGRKRKVVDEQDLAGEKSGKRLKSLRPAEVKSGAKEFPAGNKATSKSRVTFLNSLCGLPKFKALVNLVPAMPKPSAIPPNYPSWVSWYSQEAYLPEEFHSPGAFKKALSMLRKSLLDSKVFKDGSIDGPLLFLGLMYRELSRSMEIEPDTTSGCPIHLINSSFGIKEMNEIETLLLDIPLPSSE